MNVMCLSIITCGGPHTTKITIPFLNVTKIRSNNNETTAIVEQ